MGVEPMTRLYLILGGAFQGKHRYVEARFGAASLRELDPDRLPERAEGEVLMIDTTAWPDLDRIDQFSSDDWAARVTRLRESGAKAVVFIAAEMGSGILPAERSQRRLREAQGRFVEWLAAQVDEIVRLFAGVPQRLK